MRNTLKHALATLLFGATMALPLVASADAPPLIPLQGTLYNADGDAITGTYPVDITLYADEAGTTPVWSDTVSVTFAGGHFTLYLGDHDPLNTVIFRNYDEVFVGIAVDGDAEMPVFAIATSPYAGFANYCGDAETLEGRDATTLIDETVARTNMLYATVAHNHTWGDLTGVPADLADGDRVLTEAEVDAYVANNGYLTSVSATAWGDLTDMPTGFADRVDNVLTEAEVDGYVSDNGFLNTTSAVSWSQLTGVPPGLADGDNDTVLSEAEVDAFVANNGYLTSAGWGDLTGVPAGFADNVDNTLTETQVDAYANNNGYLTASSTLPWGQLTSVPAGFADGVDNGGGYAVSGNLVMPHADTSGWTQLLAGNADDTCTAVTPIGFTFPFYGATYTQFSVSTNGAVYLGPSCQAYDLSNSALPHGTSYPAIFAMQGDMNLPSGATIRYQSTGTTGAHVLNIMWTELEYLGDAAGGARVMVSLHESSGRVEINYENVLNTNGSRGANSVIGMQGAGGTSAEFVEVARSAQVIDNTLPRTTLVFSAP